MTNYCACPTEAGKDACELPPQNIKRETSTAFTCPCCNQKGKPVQAQTVKALLAVTLRKMQDGPYFFCPTQNCPIVYFLPGSEYSFSIEQVRERVYQKDPDNDDVLVCYCFQHTVGKLRTTKPTDRQAIITDINTGIHSGQCACDLRNPQGSCCLGNVRGLF